MVAFVKENVAALLVLIVLLAIGQTGLRAIERLEWIGYDQLQSTLALFAPVGRTQTLIVAIDDKSLREHGQWPWPRGRLAELVRRIDEHGAKVIGIDVFFPEPDRLGQNQDAALARAIADAPVILARFAEGGDLSDSGRVGSASRHLRIERPGVLTGGGGYDLPTVFRAGPVVHNISVLEDAATGGGLALLSRQSDGIVRKVSLIVNARGVLEPAFALEIARLASGLDTVPAALAGGGIKSIGPLANHPLAVIESGESYLSFGSYPDMGMVSAADVLNGSIPDSVLAGKIVLLGATASGLHDQVYSPLGDVLPGVAVHALAVEQLLRGVALHRPAWMAGFEAISVAVLGVVLIVVQLRLTALSVLALFLAMEGLMAALGAGLNVWLGMVFEPMYGAFVLLIVYLSTLIAAQARSAPR